MIFKSSIKLKPVQILALGFLAFIIIGTILLMLPVSSNSNQYTNFLDSLFTSTSAVCVTGLEVLDTGTYWSKFGQIVILILIQIGGIGFMTISTFIAVLFGRKVGLRGRLIVKEAFNTFHIQGLVKLVIYVVITTFVIEGLGALILSYQFLDNYNLKTSIYYGIFHSVSAFCNSGFDLFSGFSSYMEYYNNQIVILTISILVLIGGVGFFVISEIISHKKKRKYSLHSKVVLISTFILTIFSIVIFYLLEYNNTKTIGEFSFFNKLISSLLLAVSPRSAGFSTVNLEDMTTASHFFTIILMFIGAAPGSAGGGIKITTVVILLMTVVSVIKGRDDTEIFRKRIDKEGVYRAVSVAFISFMLVFVITTILTVTEKADSMIILYEVVSAFGTSGLSLQFTPSLSVIGKVFIIITMYIGRLGPLTLIFAFLYKRKLKDFSIKYPEDKIIVG